MFYVAWKLGLWVKGFFAYCRGSDGGGVKMGSPVVPTAHPVSLGRSCQRRMRWDGHVESMGTVGNLYGKYWLQK
jgi:hypothetical protein